MAHETQPLPPRQSSHMIDEENDQLSSGSDDDEAFQDAPEFLEEKLSLGISRLKLMENSIASDAAAAMRKQTPGVKPLEEAVPAQSATTASAAQQQEPADGSQDDTEEEGGVKELFDDKTLAALRRDLEQQPVIVLINPHSGGKRGGHVYQALSKQLGEHQVFNIKKTSPGDVLGELWNKMARDPLLGKLRVMAAGGDGTVTWCLGTAMRMGLEPQPAIGILPLGTGNNMAICTGWGDRFRVHWAQSDKNWAKLYGHIMDAPHVTLDCWELTMTSGNKHNLDKLPHVLHRIDTSELEEAGMGGGIHQAAAAAPTPAAAPACPSCATATADGPREAYAAAAANRGTNTAAAAAANGGGGATAGAATPAAAAAAAGEGGVEEGGGAGGASACGAASGYFYEFLAVGVMGELAHRFNDLRERHPGLFTNRIGNQLWYCLKTLQSGLFLPTAGDQGRYLHSFVEVHTRDRATGEIHKLPLPPRCRGLIILNMQIFAHVDMFGTFLDEKTQEALKAKYSDKVFVRPNFNDGLVELVGVFDGWTELLSQAVPSASSARLAQTEEVLITIVAPPKGLRGTILGRKPVTYMSLDGEPWEQPVPGREDGAKLTMRIKRCGQNRLLFNRHNNRNMPSWVQHVAASNAEQVLEPADA